MHFFSVSDRRYCFDEVTRNCFQVDQASEDALRIFEASGRTVNSKLLTKSLAAKGYDQTTIAELEDDIDEYQRLSERTFLTKDTPRKLRSIELHVSHACNLGCSYCFAGKGDYGTSPLLMTDRRDSLQGGRLPRRKFIGKRNACDRLFWWGTHD